MNPAPIRAIVAFLLASGVVASPQTSEAQPAPLPSRAGFSWHMEPRLGLDVDGDGRIEIENSHEYAHNRRRGSCTGQCPDPKFTVALRASPAGEDLGVDPTLFSYEWRVDGPSGMGVYHRIRPDLRLLLPEGHHDVDLRVRVRIPWFGSITLRSRGSIQVEDLLVVAVGDSYASGEGSPEVPRQEHDALWADATDPVIEDSHALAHRSSVSWPARVALALEAADPHTSVTFIHLAATGARIDRGVLEPRRNVALPAQVDEMLGVAGERTIDLLLAQVGGNDVGFAQVITELVDADPLLDPICYEVMLDNVWASADDGRWDRDVTLAYDPPFRLHCRPTGGQRQTLPGFSGLDDAIDRLAEALEPLDVERVVLAGYPDPTGSNAGGDTCEEIVGDVTAPFGFHEVDEEEQAEGRLRVLGPLNEALARAAAKHGWGFVDGIAAAFLEGHGYCAPWPDYGYPDAFEKSPLLFKRRLDYPEGWYRRPGVFGGSLPLNRGDVSWYRTASQSAALQGPAPRFLTSGTLHPNELGHAAIARLVLSALDGY